MSFLNADALRLSTDITETLLAPACHMVAPFILLNPKIAVWALFEFRSIDEIQECGVILCFDLGLV